MHPILTRPDRLGLYLAAWIPIALLVAIELATVGGLKWGTAAVLATPLVVAYGFVCLAAWYPCRVTPLDATARWRVAATHASAALLSATLLVLLGSLWARALGVIGLPEAAEGFGIQIPVLFVTGVLLFLLSTFVHYLLISYETARQSETRSLELDVLARDAQLRALRAQVDPHFLFNCLHSIAALIGSDPAGARRMCVLLADLLRDSVKLGSRDHITVGQELSLVRQYLSIEQVRFGPRLGFLAEMAPGAGAALVPPLLLQPLVENAVKHGIAGLVEGGTVTVRAEPIGDDLVLRVENPYDADRTPSSGTRVGLQNVRSRLITEFGPSASLAIADGNGRYEAVIRLPLAAVADR